MQKRKYRFHSHSLHEHVIPSDPSFSFVGPFFGKRKTATFVILHLRISRRRVRSNTESMIRPQRKVEGLCQTGLIWASSLQTSRDLFLEA